MAELWDIVNALAPAITSAGGALLAVKILYNKVKDDIAELKSDVKAIGERQEEDARKNADDHGKVIDRISKIEGHINGMRAPWNTRNQH